jgi:chromosomal replication initiator protein
VVPGVTSIPIPGTAVGDTTGRPRLPAGRLRFEHFIAGPENALAVTAARELLGGRPGHCTPLVLCGRTGVGKSHLARGLARQWDRRQNCGPSVVVTADQFAEQLNAAIRSDSLASFRSRHRRTSLLVFEHLDTLPAKPSSVQHELIHTLDALHATGRFAIVTSRMPVHTIAGLERLLRNRLLGGLVLTISPPSATARFEILRLSALTLSLPISSDQLHRLAEKTTGTVPDLIAALLEVLHGAPGADQTSRSPGSRKTSRAAQRPRSGDRIQRIITATARHFSLRPAQLRGQSRQRSIVMARGTALYLARDLTGQSYATIGHFFGGRDHTTVLYHCRKIERLLQTDATTRLTIEHLRHQLTSRENRDRQ